MRRQRRKGNFDEEVNPMESVSNLADVMLILSVGIMLALILHWNVKIDDVKTTQNDQAEKETMTFSNNDLENKSELPENMKRMGDVYYDAETDTYYILENNSSAEE